jgi:HEAT repeat protein
LFLNALSHPRRSIRLRGLMGLEALGDPSTVIDVIGVLEHEEDPDLRVVAARTLGSIGDIAASAALRTAIESPHFSLREQAVLALLAIGKEDVGRYLLRFLGSGRQLGTVETLELIALVPDPTLVHLIEPFLDSEDPRVRSQASVTVFSILEKSGTQLP